MDPLWAIPIVLLFFAIFLGIIAFLDYLSEKTRKVPLQYKAV